MKKAAGIAIVALALLLLAFKAKAKPGAKFLLKALWGQRKFTFTTPVGIFVVDNPDTTSPSFHHLSSTDEYELGWQAPFEGLIIASLVHKKGVVFAETYEIDLVAKSAKYNKEFNEVVITG